MCTRKVLYSSGRSANALSHASSISTNAQQKCTLVSYRSQSTSRSKQPSRQAGKQLASNGGHVDTFVHSGPALPPTRRKDQKRSSCTRTSAGAVFRFRPKSAAVRPIPRRRGGPFLPLHVTASCPPLPPPPCARRRQRGPAASCPTSHHLLHLLHLLACCDGASPTL